MVLINSANSKVRICEMTIDASLLCKVFFSAEKCSSVGFQLIKPMCLHLYNSLSNNVFLACQQLKDWIFSRMYFHISVYVCICIYNYVCVHLVVNAIKVTWHVNKIFYYCYYYYHYYNIIYKIYVYAVW